jgi:hypothetical protein
MGATFPGAFYAPAAYGASLSLIGMTRGMRG